MKCVFILNRIFGHGLVTWGCCLSVVLFSLMLPKTASAQAETPRRPGTVLYQLKPGANPADLQRLNGVLNARGAAAVKTLKGLNIKVAAFNGNAITEEQLCEDLKATGAVAFAEPDYLVPHDALPNDPSYSSQWHHATINSPGAWDHTTGSASILVGVCDSGVESSHPDLAANLQLPGYNSADGSNNSEPITGHGTAVAGCVSAVGNNGVGVSGVGWTTKVLPIRITNLGTGNAYISDAADGIRYAADQGAKVVNLSYRMANFASIDSAGQYLRDLGGLLFVSAANDNQDPGWPDYPSFVVVASTTSSDTRSSFSNWGTYVDITAPGSGIYTTSTGGNYGNWSGTSFSSPISAGLAALIYAVDPAFTPTEVENFIFSTCVDLGDPGDDNVFGHGRIDAAAAVSAAVATANPSVQIAMLGDYGDGSAAEASVAGLINGWNPDLIITAGDNRYGATTFDTTVGQFFCNYLTDAGTGPNCSGGNSPVNAFFPSPGNHDYNDGAGINEYLNYFTLPGTGVASSGTSGNERYYDFISGPVHFFAVDSQGALTSASDATAQQNWLAAQLAASTAPWKVVYFHHAPYSSSSNHGSNTAMQWPFASWGADAVLAGHDHTYERVHAEGIVYFVNGLGGRSIYGLGTPIAGSQVRYNADYGAMRITADSDALTFEFVNISGTVIDTHTLNQDAAGVVNAQIAQSSDDAEERASDGGIDLASTDIELGDDPGHNEDQTVGLRFQDLAIPQGAAITAAYLEFVTDEIDTVATDVEIRAQAADNAATFSAALNDITSRANSSTGVNWSIPAWNTVGELHQSPDLSALVQEVVSRGGWSSGNSMAFLITGTGSRTSESYDGSPAEAARLHVEFDTTPPTNSPPVAVDDLANTSEDTPVVVAVLANDSDADGDPLSVSSFSQGADGSVTDNGDGTLTYTPDNDFNGSDSFTYSISDGQGGSDNATVQVNVGPVNDDPAFLADPFSASNATEGGSYSDSIAGSAADVDTGDVLTYSKQSGPAWLSIALNGTLSGTPSDGDVGLNAFGVQVNDGNGGVDSATLEITVDALGGPVADLASGESTTFGSVSGSLANTYVNDDTYEVLTEEETNGRPDRRRSRLEHVWTFDVTGGELVTFYVEAHHSANAEGDDFRFAWSSDNSSFTDLLTVTKTADDNTVQWVVLPSGTSGTVYIRVVDTDRTQGNRGLDSLFVDALFITSESSSVPPNPASNPSPSNGATGVGLNPTLTWTAGAQASSHDVYFGTSPVPGPAEFQGNQAGTSLSPGALATSTTFHWRVDEVNGVGTTAGPVWSFTTAAGTPQMHVAAITVGTKRNGKNYRATATVTIVDSATGQPVSGATVSGDFTGAFSESKSGTTAANGAVELTTSAKLRLPFTVTFTVTNVVAPTHDYAPGNNVETSDTGSF